MSTSYTNDERNQVIAGASGVLVGLGVVTMALFPLAIPILILTLVAALPLLPVVLVGAVAAAVLVIAGRAVRAVLRTGGRALGADRSTATSTERAWGAGRSSRRPRTRHPAGLSSPQR